MYVLECSNVNHACCASLPFHLAISWQQNASPCGNSFCPTPEAASIRLFVALESERHFKDFVISCETSAEEFRPHVTLEKCTVDSMARRNSRNVVNILRLARFHNTVPPTTFLYLHGYPSVSIYKPGVDGYITKTV